MMPPMATCRTFLLLLILVLLPGARSLGAEGGPDPLRVLRHIREGRPIDPRDREYVRRYRQHTGWSMEELAEQLEASWQRSEELDRLRRDGRLPPRTRTARLDTWQGIRQRASAHLPLLGGLALIVTLFAIATIAWRQRRLNIDKQRSLRESLSASELVLTATHAPPEEGEEEQGEESHAQPV